MQCSLTKREGDVLLLLAQRKTLAQISDYLVVGLATVKTHTHNIYKKLDVHSKQELYQFLGLENLSYSAKSSTKPTR
ncbi:response regulator transcription factor [uncultured Slackia sp.]|uniref:response regulator transcription factor n=1 Tax=uncultured Slackia sp. TaxID=665903 RepID=UPI00345BEA57